MAFKELPPAPHETAHPANPGWFLLPGNLFQVAWTYLTLLATEFHAVTIPAAMAMGVPWQDPTGMLWTVTRWITVFFVVDLLLNFRSAFVQDGEIVTDGRIIARRYGRGWLIPDLVATIPWDLVALALGDPALAGLLSFGRLFRLARIPSLYARLSPARAGHTLASRVAMTSFWIVFFTNLIACLWLLIEPQDSSRSPTTVYVEALYWAVTTLATVGYGDITPKSDGGRIFAMAVMVIGAGLYGFVIGNISAILVNINARQAHRKERLATLVGFLRYYRIPRQLQVDAVSFYNHTLLNRAAHDDEILAELPPKLRDELQIHINIHLLRRTPFFRGVPVACLRELSGALEQRVYAPGEKIIQAGEVGDEMFILLHGVLHVFSPEGKLITRMRRRDVFGEMALLGDIRRTATVRAATYSDVVSLSREDFQRILALYPDLRDKMETMARQRGFSLPGSE